MRVTARFSVALPTWMTWSIAMSRAQPLVRSLAPSVTSQCELVSSSRSGNSLDSNLRSTIPKSGSSSSRSSRRSPIASRLSPFSIARMLSESSSHTVTVVSG